MGRLFAFATTIPAVLAASWLLASLPLLLGRAFYPAAIVPLFAVVAAVLCWRAWPTVSERAAQWRSVPAWPVLAVLAIVIAFGVISYLTSSEHIIIRRDAGSYSVATTWLAQHGHLDMPAPYDVFGGSPQAGTPTGIGFASQGTYYAGGQIVPQFMSGAPAVFSIGYWIAGIQGVLHANAVIGALSLLAFAGLVARLVGPRWAPPATLALALMLPQWHSSRTPLSEPLTQLLIVGGLVLVVDALESRRAAFGVAGMVLGLTLMVRIDALADLLPLAPFVAWLWLRDRRPAAFFTAGVVAGMVIGVIDGVVLSRPYLRDIAASLATISGLFVAVVLASVVVAYAVRAHPEWVNRVRRRGPEAVAVGFVVVGALLALRPFIYTAHAHLPGSVREMIATAQRAAGDPVDQYRTYYEHSAAWLAWWVGWAAFGLAVLAAAWLIREVLRGRRAPWLPVLLVMCVTAVLVLLRPSITPDHPWADRRFVPVVLPAIALLATVAVAGVVSWARRRSRVGAWALGALGLAALIVPPVLSSRSLIGESTEQGEVALVHRVCDQLRPGDAVLMVGGQTRTYWTTTVSVFCNVPTAWLRDVESDDIETPAQIAAVNAEAKRVRESGGQLVLMITKPDARASLPVSWGDAVAMLDTHQDAHTILKPPRHRERLSYSVWLARVPPSGLPTP